MAVEVDPRDWELEFLFWHRGRDPEFAQAWGQELKSRALWIKLALISGCSHHEKQLEDFYPPAQGSHKKIHDRENKKWNLHLNKTYSKTTILHWDLPWSLRSSTKEIKNKGYVINIIGETSRVPGEASNKPFCWVLSTTWVHWSQTKIAHSWKWDYNMKFHITQGNSPLQERVHKTVSYLALS